MTVEEALKRAKMCIGISPSENIMESFKVISEAIEEIQQYRAIGTVEEFRQLKEKATAKKVVVKGVMGFDGEESFCCPNCGLDISQWGYGVCIDCGQKLLY